MIAPIFWTNPTADEEIFVNDVHCRIADCRRRLRSRRSTLRAQQHPPRQKLVGTSEGEAQDQLEEREEALIT
jgi:hypothetical protein